MKLKLILAALVASLPAFAADLTVNHYSATGANPNTMIRPYLRVVNPTANSIDLSKHTVAWDINEAGYAPESMVAECWSVSKGACSDLRFKISALTPQTVNGKSRNLRVTITLPAQTLRSGEYMELQWGLHDKNWARSFNETDDWSFTSANNAWNIAPNAGVDVGLAIVPVMNWKGPNASLPSATTSNLGDVVRVDGESFVLGPTGWELLAESKIGPVGPQGLQGIQGVAGPVGDVGPVGPQGIQGEKGDQGIQGIQGVTGAVGPVGPKGDTGATGPQGIKGDQGEQGVVGPVGPQGIQGEKGDRGEQGIQGVAGLVGDVGPVGPQGIQGVAGPVGPVGPQGAPADMSVVERYKNDLIVMHNIQQGELMQQEFRTNALADLLNQTRIMLSSMSNDLNQVRSENLTQKNEIIRLNTLLAHFSREGNEIIISGANLNIVNGTGYNTSTNSLGNLQIGYGVNASQAGTSKAGSHNIVVGENSYAAYGGIVSGRVNFLAGPHSAIISGEHQRAGGTYGVIVGGTYNNVNGLASVAVGGNANEVELTSEHATVVGGTGNRSSARGSSVFGGYYNIAQGDYSGIFSGHNNLINGAGDFSVILGGGNVESSAVGAAAINTDYSSLGGSNSTTIGGVSVSQQIPGVVRLGPLQQ